MDDLIKALTIFRKYANLKWPTHCEHDTLYVVGIHKDQVSLIDIDELNELGFVWSDSEDCFVSFKFGSS